VKEKPHFELETELCAAFIDDATKRGWTCYPETAGFDILCVNQGGFQLGIQAKLKLNWKVIEQIIPNDTWPRAAPHHLGVLVPDGNPLIANILRRCAGIEVFHFEPWSKTFFWPCFFEDQNPKKLCAIPDYIPDVEAGASAPRTLSPWKIQALRIIADCETAGFVTRANFRTRRIDMRRWTQSGWLKPVGNGKWVLGDVDFHTLHPTVYAKILDEVNPKPEKI
jgi:hypothetical protein